MDGERQSARALLVRARGRQSAARRRAVLRATTCCPARAATRWVAKAARPVRICRSSARRRARSICSSPSSSRARTSPRASTSSRLTLKNGETETGSLASESPTQIVLKRADNTTVTIDPKQVKTRVDGAVVHAGDLWTGADAHAVARHRGVPRHALTQPRQAEGEAAFGESNRAMSSTSQEVAARWPSVKVTRRGVIATALAAGVASGARSEDKKMNNREPGIPSSSAPACSAPGPRGTCARPGNVCCCSTHSAPRMRARRRAASRGSRAAATAATRSTRASRSIRCRRGNGCRIFRACRSCIASACCSSSRSASRTSTSRSRCIGG